MLIIAKAVGNVVMGFLVNVSTAARPRTSCLLKWNYKHLLVLNHNYHFTILISSEYRIYFYKM